jgi:hypothetical protein
MTTALKTDAGTANIFEVRTGWGWTLGGSEGIEDSFEAAVAAAEIEAAWINDQALLEALAESIPADVAEQAIVDGISLEDGMPGLHVYLWRGKDVSDLPEAVASMKLVLEGHWDGGRALVFAL